MFIPSDTATISASVLDFVAVLWTLDALPSIPIQRVMQIPVVDLFSSWSLSQFQIIISHLPQQYLHKESNNIYMNVTFCTGLYTRYRR